MSRRNRREEDPERYVVALYEALPNADLNYEINEMNGLEFVRGNFVKIGWHFFGAAIHILVMPNKNDRRRYLITPDYSGDPDFADSLEAAYKFKSRNQAKLSGERLRANYNANYEVLTMSFLGTASPNCLPLA